MENHPRYLEVAWGCHYAGAVYTAASSRLTSDELAYIVDDCGAKVFITSKHKADQAAEIVADTPGVELRLMLDGTIDGYESYEDAVAAASRRAAATTASPAPTCSTRRARPGCPRASSRAFRAEPLETTRRSGHAGCCSCCSASTAETVYLSPAPLYHAAPLRFSMSSQRPRRHRGGDGALRRRGVPRAHRAPPGDPHARSCRRCSCACSSCRRTCAPRYDVSSLQCVIHAAAPCPVPVKQQMIEWFGPVIHEYYAGTEGNGFVYCNSEQWLAHPGTVGMPIGCTVHIVGDDGEEVPPGRERHDLLRGRAASSSTTTTRRRRRARATRRAGARSATSATSTTTASST